MYIYSAFHKDFKALHKDANFPVNQCYNYFTDEKILVPSETICLNSSWLVSELRRQAWPLFALYLNHYGTLPQTMHLKIYI